MSSVVRIHPSPPSFGSVHFWMLFLLFPSAYASPCKAIKKFLNFPSTRTKSGDFPLFINTKILGCPKNTPENIEVKKEAFYSPISFFFKARVMAVLTFTRLPVLMASLTDTSENSSLRF